MAKYNAAQHILISLGGTAALVGGWMEHYYADTQTPKKLKQRPNRLGGFSKGLRDANTEKNKLNLKS